MIPWLVWKSFKSRKKETRASIVMIAFTIMVLTSVLLFLDASVEYKANHTARLGGGQDLAVSVRGNIWGASSFMDYPAGDVLLNIPSISHVSPQLYFQCMRGDSWEVLLAYDIARDFNAGIGLTRVEAPSSFDLALPLPPNGTIISGAVARAHGLTIGDQLSLFIPVLERNVNVTVSAVYDRNYLGVPHSPAFLVDRSFILSLFPEMEGKTNYLVFGFHESNTYYDFRDIEASRNKIARIGAGVAAVFDPGEHVFRYHKWNNFDQADQIQVFFTFLQNFIFMITVLLSAMLIYSSVSVSVGEKVREFGILQAIGCKKHQVLSQIVLRGVIIGAAGSVIGVIAGVVVVATVLIPASNIFFIHLFVTELDFVVNVGSLLLPVVAGMVTTVIVGAIPAVHVMRMTTTQALHPEKIVEGMNVDRGETRNRTRRGWRWSLAGAMTFTMAIWLLTNSSSVMFVENVPLFINLVIVVLACFMAGLVMLFLGTSPPLFNLVLRVFSRWTTRFKDVLRFGVHHHQQRNKTLSILLLLCMGMLIFSSSLADLIGGQLMKRLQLGAGSNINVSRLSGMPVQIDAISELSGIDGIEQMTGVFDNLDGIRRYLGEMSLDIECSDASGFHRVVPQIRAIDGNFFHATFNQHISMREGDAQQSIGALGDLDQHNAVASATLADALRVAHGDTIIVEFKRGGETVMISFTIVGIYHDIPGFYQVPDFFQQPHDPCLVISTGHFKHGFGLSADTGPTRMYIRTRDGVNDDVVANDIRSCLSSAHGDTRASVYHAERDAEYLLSQVMVLVVFVIFLSIVLQALGGLINSSYISFLERSLEIKIFRTLGLSINDTRHMFFLEIMVILIVNAILGFVLGTVLVLNFLHVIQAVLHVRATVTLPWFPMLLMFMISAAVTYLMVRHVFKAEDIRQITGNH